MNIQGDNAGGQLCSDISYMLVVTLDETPSSTLTKVRYYAILRQTQLCQINGEALGLVLANFEFQSSGVKKKNYNHTFNRHSILTAPMQGKQILGKKSYQSKM